MAKSFKEKPVFLFVASVLLMRLNHETFFFWIMCWVCPNVNHKKEKREVDVWPKISFKKGSPLLTGSGQNELFFGCWKNAKYAVIRLTWNVLRWGVLRIGRHFSLKGRRSRRIWLERRRATTFWRKTFAGSTFSFSRKLELFTVSTVDTFILIRFIRREHNLQWQRLSQMKDKDVWGGWSNSFSLKRIRLDPGAMSWRCTVEKSSKMGKNIPQWRFY